MLEPEMTSKYLDVGPAARYVNGSASTLNKWRGRGVGPRFYYFGSRVKYAISDLDEFMKSQAATKTRGRPARKMKEAA